MRGALEALLLSIGFLTVIPVPDRQRAPYARAVRFFPIVGAALGMLVAGLDVILTTFVPLGVASVLDLAVLAMLSGGLHLDGLADTADGLFFPGEREKRLAIMRDSRTGAFGVAAVALVLLLETAALASVSRPARVPVLVAAAALSRWSMGFALWSSPAARPDGLGASFKARLRLGDVLIASALAAAIAAAVLGLDAIVAFAVAWLVAMGVAAIARARIGGMTGDVCGGVGELAFAGQLVLASAIAR